MAAPAHWPQQKVRDDSAFASGSTSNNRDPSSSASSSSSHATALPVDYEAPSADSASAQHLVPSALPKLDTVHLSDDQGATANPSSHTRVELASSSVPATTSHSDANRNGYEVGSSGGNATQSGHGNGSAATEYSTTLQRNDSTMTQGPKTASFFASSPMVGPMTTSSMSRQPSAASYHHRKSPSTSSQLSFTSPLPPSGLEHSNSINSGGSGSSRGGASDLHHNNSRVGRTSSNSFRAVVRLSTPTDYDTSALSSASSIRSRRNWDDFEGKSITPLPSPGIGSDYEAVERSGGMFPAVDASGTQYWANLARGNSMSRDTSTSAFLSAPNTAVDPSFSDREATMLSPPRSASAAMGNFVSQDESASRNNSMNKTKNFFGTSHTPLSPPLKTPTKEAGMTHGRTTSTQSNDSVGSWTNLNTLSPVATPPKPPEMLPPLTTLAPSRPRDSESPTTPKHLANLPTLPSETPSWRTRGRVDGSPTREPASADRASVGLGPAPPFDSAGRPSNARYTHGPSDMLTGSSIKPSVGGTSTQSPSARYFRDLTSTTGGSPRREPPPPLHYQTGKRGSIASPSKRGSIYSAAASGLASPALKSSIILVEDPDDLESEDEASGKIGPYKVERALGVGAFSKVVLARPEKILTSSPANTIVSTPGHTPNEDNGPEGPSTASSSSSSFSISDKQKDKDLGSRRRSMQWIRSWKKSTSVLNATAEHLRPHGMRTKSGRSLTLHNVLGSGSSSSLEVERPQTPRSPQPPNPHQQMQQHRQGSISEPSSQMATFSNLLEAPAEGNHKLVALKMLAREPCAHNERMRVSWVREVEVLRHINHPCLIKFIDSFSTPKHHVLVLEQVPGGELFTFLSNHQEEIAKREWLVRRLFAELAHAVGWMHTVNLVHRDIKLENAILTSPELSTNIAKLTPSMLGPTPLLKVSDFGLSRFIDPEHPLLETRCGSEEYASPELIIGKKYDGRKTDCWAMGVVLYSIVCNGLPFVEGVTATMATDDSYSQHQQALSRPRDQYSQDREMRERKAHLLRIAKADLRWPGHTNDDSLDDPQLPRCPPKLRLLTPYAKHLISRLLRRDPNKRSTAWEVFDDPWLTHGSFSGPPSSAASDSGPRPGDTGMSLDASVASMNSGNSSTGSSSSSSSSSMGTRSRSNGAASAMSSNASFDEVKTTVAVPGESSACGQVLELPPDPRTSRGKEWIEAVARVSSHGEVSALAKGD